jgi:hypothetical protein
MTSNLILVIKLSQRSNSAVKMQELFTEFGCSIKTRLGLHETSETSCSPSGIIVLQLFATLEEAQKMEARFAEVPGVKAQLVNLND